MAPKMIGGVAAPPAPSPGWNLNFGGGEESPLCPGNVIDATN
jgi:hypothetical protein